MMMQWRCHMTKPRACIIVHNGQSTISRVWDSLKPQTTSAPSSWSLRLSVMPFPWPCTAKLCCLPVIWLNVTLPSLGSPPALSLHSGLWIVGPASALALRHLICRVCCAWFDLEANAGKTTIGGLAARGFGERPSRKNETRYHR